MCYLQHSTQRNFQRIIMSQLVVYKASAGSGKTFTLAISYIELLITNTQAYKEILAVTFTNKATAEMKERILSQLYGIWKSDSDSDVYLNVLMERTRMSETDIRQKAGEALLKMLHDYSRFRVETIDSFFQSVMRNLARELELSPNLNIELNGPEVVSEAVDSMMEKLESKSVVLNWIFDFIDEKIADNKRWDVSGLIKNFARNILNEEYIAKGGKLRESLNDSSTISSYRKELREIERTALEQMKAFSEQFHSILEENGLIPNDLKNATRGIASYFNKINNGDLDDSVRNKTVEKSLSSPDEWATKTSSRAQEIKTLAASELIPLLDKAEEFRIKNSRLVNSSQLSLLHINELQLLVHIDEEMRKLNRQENRFLLSDTNALLHSLINDGDSSFVFEKIGSSIRNIMIDEFQDTSKMQWDNFKLLLLEGLSQGASSLIVGDVKQSIYRWRNGDWTILNNLGDNGVQFGHFPVDVRTLDTNRRSESNIIRFNNTLFPALVTALSNSQEDELGRRCEPLERAYDDVAQKSPKTDKKGFAQIRFIETKDQSGINNYEKNVLNALKEEIQGLINHGVALNDIAILVRKNKFIPLIADFISKELEIPIISDEAFRLSASQALKIIIDGLRYLSDPTNTIVEANLALNYQRVVLKKEISIDELLLSGNVKAYLPTAFVLDIENYKELPLYNLIEQLQICFELDKLENQDAYLFTFFDRVLDYLQNESSLLEDFIRFWDESLYNVAISSTNIEGIQILSIHKSKGLEFHTVLLPFCDWTLESDRNDQLIWCTPEEAPYNKIDLVPVNYGKKMEQSIYLKDYLEERLQLWVDNLNILYVALTRAGSNLFMFCKAGDKSSVSGLIEQCLPLVAQNQEVDWNPESPYQFGEICPSKALRIKESKNVFLPSNKKEEVRMQSLPYDFEFRQSNRSADFIAGRESNVSPYRFINRGMLLHQLFASISNPKDIDRAIRNLKFEGVIDSIETEREIRGIAESAFDKEEVKAWYDPTWDVFNECTILYRVDDRLETRRPDRVVVKDGKAVVIDFKFGKQQKTYVGQVKEYMKLLSQMGYSLVEGYIWYVSEDIIEEVK